MNILLIGNGFDLEHKLPTAYKDFLNFCESAINTYAYIHSEHYNPKSHKPPCDMLLTMWSPPHNIKNNLLNNTRALFSGSSFDDILTKLYQCIYDNLWYRFFRARFSRLSNNWIDFEKEISHVIQTLESIHSFLAINTNILALPDKLKSETEELLNDFGNAWFITCASKDTLLSFRDKLSYDLDKFIRALELYLSVFVNKIHIPPEDFSPDIKFLRPDMVLSFNYTNTYERIFDQTSDMRYCYIHGKAQLDSTVESCNLVLGIDEHLSDDRRNSDLDFLHFKKYFQRIYKSTDNGYLNWIDVIRKYSANTHKLYIFGHSLDVTDKDVLHQLICNDNVQTKIFYYRKHEHDKSVLGQLIHNLVRIIGQDELIRRTGGSHKTIEFIPQTLRE